MTSFRLSGDATLALPASSHKSVLVLASHARLGNSDAVRLLTTTLSAQTPEITDGGILDDWDESDVPETPPGRVVLLVQEGAPHGRLHRLLVQIQELFAPEDIAISYV